MKFKIGDKVKFCKKGYHFYGHCGIIEENIGKDYVIWRPDNLENIRNVAWAENLILLTSISNHPLTNIFK